MAVWVCIWVMKSVDLCILASPNPFPMFQVMAYPVEVCLPTVQPFVNKSLMKGCTSVCRYMFGYLRHRGILTFYSCSSCDLLFGLKAKQRSRRLVSTFLFVALRLVCLIWENKRSWLSELVERRHTISYCGAACTEMSCMYIPNRWLLVCSLGEWIRWAHNSWCSHVTL